jgi:hypothetical protein
VLIDHEGLAAARVSPDGKLAIQGHEFDAIVLPDAIELPPAAASVARQFEQSGGRLLRGPWDAARLSGPSLVERVRPEYQISPAAPNVALGAFVRDGRSVALVVNVGRQPYTGALSVRAAGDWQILDPADGTRRAADMQAPRQIRLSLAPCQALLLVSGAE